MVKVEKDLTGLQFGRLTVIRQVEDKIYSNKKYAQWECRCSCDNKIIKVVGNELRRGKTQSCGCLWKEKHYQANKKYNKYIEHENYYECIIESKNKIYNTYINIEDYIKVKDHSWCLNAEGYIMTVIDGKCIYMARLIMNCSDPKKIVDHINHNILDNRKENLRIVTKGENNINQEIAKNNTSGYSDVCWREDANKWSARISINNKRINLGMFDTIEEAAFVRKQAEIKYYGEYRNIHKDWGNI